MKRSELNLKMKEAKEFIDQMNFKLPPFAYWTPDEWTKKGHEYDEILDNMLGWCLWGRACFYTLFRLCL